MTPVDRILAIINTGLQTAGDTAYGDDQHGVCWRCKTEGPDLCTPCRETLLAETVREMPDEVPVERTALGCPVECVYCAAMEGYILREATP